LIYTDSQLYGLKSKKMLRHFLQVQTNQLFNQTFILDKIIPYIDTDGKSRLIEVPDKELRAIQKKIKNMLGKLVLPDYVFSGVKGKSYVDNATHHSGTKFTYKVDVTAFFPSISREKVYLFFREKLKASPDVAESLTNLTTVDLHMKENIQEIHDFLRKKNIKTWNHLISGAPTSPILSYLANSDMFDALYSLSKENKIVMTVYIDDIVFSSSYRISYKIRTKILNIIKQYGLQVNKKKLKLYTRKYPKKITGVIIDKNGNSEVPNSLRKKIITELHTLKNDPNNLSSRQRLQGLVTSARQIKKETFQNICSYAYNHDFDRI